MNFNEIVSKINATEEEKQQWTKLHGMLNDEGKKELEELLSKQI